MGFNSILSIISFLTIIPVPKSTDTQIDTIARNMHLFPIIGALIGIIIGTFGYVLFTYLPKELSGLFVTVGFIVITGLHHTDALSDFADGLMIQGDKTTRKKVMSDPHIGSAGAISLILYVIGLIIAISKFNSSITLFLGITISEIIAKYVMVIQAGKGKSAWTGFSSPFTEFMKNKKKILTSTILTVMLVLFLGGLEGIVSLLVSLFIGFIIYHIALRKFGGITGDVLGTSNEIIRLSSLFLLSNLIS